MSEPVLGFFEASGDLKGLAFPQSGDRLGYSFGIKGGPLAPKLQAAPLDLADRAIVLATFKPDLIGVPVSYKSGKFDTVY